MLEETKLVTSLQPQAFSGASAGDAVDTAGYDEAVVIFACGVIAANGTLDVKVQECDTSDGTFTDVEDAVFSQKTPTTDQAMYAGYIRCEGVRKRWLKAHATQATAAATGAVAFLLGGKNFTGAPQSFAFNV
ncbi:MAG TPA: hypothetical protein PKK95_09245 [Vicinamibacterales bacterium]|nr:hypothetical protein [Vicinamibacterales bacterium]